MDTWCLEQISTGGAYFFYTYKVFTIHKSHQICSEKILQILNAINIMEPKFFLLDLWCCVDVSHYFKNSFSTIFKKRFFTHVERFSRMILRIKGVCGESVNWETKCSLFSLLSEYFLRFFRKKVQGGGKEFVAISRKILGGGQQGLLYFGFFSGNGYRYESLGHLIISCMPRVELFLWYYFNWICNILLKYFFMDALCINGW